MLCLCLTKPLEDRPEGDLYEWRLDLFDSYTLEELRPLRKSLKKPVIFALRSQEQGGRFRGSEEERCAEILRLATLEPTYFDLEWTLPSSFVAEFARRFPSIRIVISSHDFAKTPSDLEGHLKQMQRPGGHLYKMACMANSTNDALRMLCFVKKHAPLLGVCMGTKGALTRILGPLVGAPWTFAPLDQPTAPGQISPQELRSLYGLESGRQIYGLVGNPVSQSISHLTHNHLMRRLHLNGVYVKMEVEKEELAQFFALAKELGIRGLSVTMPLKEAVLPYLHRIEEKEVGAVNTLFFERELLGINTDGKGALDALEAKCKVEGRLVVILGAGGAARALVHEALARGARVHILNRTRERALELARLMGAQGGALEELAGLPYEVLINTTPDPMPIPQEAIRPRTLVMDIKTRPKMTRLLEEASAKGCTLVYGYEMFINQALGQYGLWFPHIDRKAAYRILEEETLRALTTEAPHNFLRMM